MQRLEEDGEDISFEDAVSAMVEDRLLDLHTCIPAKVQSQSNRRVTVETIVPYTLENDNGDLVEDRTYVLKNIPVMMPGTKTGGVAYPLTAGDTGMVMISQVSLDKFKESGDEGPPMFRERHGLNGAWFIPGILPGQESTEQESSIPVLYGDCVALVKVDAGDHASLASVVNSNFEEIKEKFNEFVQKYNAHEHLVTTTSKTLGPPYDVIDDQDPSTMLYNDLQVSEGTETSVSDVASSKVKLE